MASSILYQHQPDSLHSNAKINVRVAGRETDYLSIEESIRSSLRGMVDKDPARHAILPTADINNVRFMLSNLSENRTCGYHHIH